jgi:outer membrane protein with beta-barrel domain
MNSMKKYIILFFSFLVFAQLSSAQSYAFGVKGGLTTGIQKWDNFDRDVLLSYHGIAFIETAPEENKFAVFTQLGYHVKGSTIRNRNFVNVVTGTISKPPTTKFKFNTISLTLGGKQKYDWGIDNKVYYLFGFRGDYIISTNLDQYEDFNNVYPIYPFDSFVRKWNYGATVGGGLEFSISDYVAGILEFTVNPDFSKCYRQPPIFNVYDPYTGSNRNFTEREIINTTFEITVGFRFLHEIEYID